MLSMGWNPGLVVMGGDTLPRGTEINPSAKYELDHFSHLFAYRNCIDA